AQRDQRVERTRGDSVHEFLKEKAHQVRLPVSAHWSAGPCRARRTNLHWVLARDQLVLARRVDLEQEELAVDQVAVGVEGDRLAQDRGRLVCLLYCGQHVCPARGLAPLAHPPEGLV